MRTSTCYKPRTRCHTPLIEICDNTSQIKLDLNTCGACAGEPTALLLRKAGCPEYETVCEEIPKTSCCPYTYPFNIIKRTVEVPKPAIKYPLHEIDASGASVFALDGKLKNMGYGRYNAVVLVGDEESDLHFDVDYIPSALSLRGVSTEVYGPVTEDC